MSGHAAALGQGGEGSGPDEFRDVGFRHLGLRLAESGGGATDNQSLSGADRPDKGAGECGDHTSGFQTRSNPRFSKSFTFAVAKRVAP